MNSKSSMPAVRRRQMQRSLQRYAPWVLWFTALAIAIWLAGSVAGAGVAPGAAELRSVTMTSPEPTRIAEISVRPGEQVNKGQVVARLETGSLRASLAVALAELNKLELDVAAQGANLRVSTLETAEQLEGDSERASLAVAQLEAQEQRDSSELEQLDSQIARQKQLVDEKLASAETLNSLNLRRAALAREVSEYKRTLAQARAHARASTRRLGQWHSEKSASEKGQASSLPETTTTQQAESLDPRIAPYVAAAEAQRERVRELESRIDALNLRVPFSGRIGEVFLHAGDTALAGSAVLTVIDDKPGQVVVYVDQMWAHRISIGDRARLRPSDRSGPARDGTVSAVGAAIIELPPRFRPIPDQPAYGRSVYIALQYGETAPLPGQAFNVTFRRASKSSEHAPKKNP